MSWKVGHPIKRDGTNQTQRLLDALRPERNPIDARRTEDLLLFVYEMAGQFAYYNYQNGVDGDWRAFFEHFEIEEGDSKEEKLQKIRLYLGRVNGRRDNSTFMTILLAFLKLFSYLQDDINTLTKKHLEFYYEKVLGFRRLPPKPDEVHLLFELSPHIQQHRIGAGTALKAGNDSMGKPLTYVTNREIIANKAKLAAIKTTLITPEGSIYAAEVANSADGLGRALTGEPAKWPTFGHPDFMQKSTVGFAVASPLLLLKEGQRIITLTLTFGYDGAEEGQLPSFSEADFRQLIAYGSGETEWISLDLNLVEDIDWEEKKVTFEIVVPPEKPAIIAYNHEALDFRLNTHFPVLRLVLNPEQTAFNNLKEIFIREVLLVVKVLANADQAGVQDLIVQNDTGLLDSSTTFFPFGATPYKGSQFYIGSPEVFSKSLDSLEIQLQWAGLPDNINGFTNYYDTGNSELEDNYDNKYRINNNYKVEPYILKEKTWKKLDSSKGLFELNASRLSSKHTIELNYRELRTLLGTESLPDFEELGLELPQGFIRLSLIQDFGHHIYPNLFAKIARDGSDNFPNPPYTPSLQAISLGYTASQSIQLNHQNPYAKVFHILPFGSKELNSYGEIRFIPRVPQAALYLGLEDFEPGQNLHLLFQVAEGSAASFEAIRQEDIQWHYLTEEGWINSPLSGSEIFIDTTLGLQKSGIMAFSIGRDAVAHSSLLPKGLHWLRASINKAPDGAANSIAIHTQAISAVFQDNNNDLNHLLSPLSANSISSLVDRDSSIRKIEQPYASFGGAAAEQNTDFYARLSERLRHKQRAITFWDIERLVLRQFPELYEAKAIPHTGFDTEGFYSEFQPGQLTVVLIPQLRNQNAVNPLQPRVSTALLEDVRRFLQPLCSQFVGQSTDALHIINPRYEPIQLDFKVGFREGYDGGYYAEVLNEGLRRQLSPWAYEEGEDIRFGGKVYKSQLLAFVEEQEYVDYVTDFKLVQYNSGPGVGESCVELDLIVYGEAFDIDVDIVKASTASSILVSAEQHLIHILQPSRFPCAEPNVCADGIGCWYVAIDLVVQ